jgi:glutamate dehydrogenase/leucine dehydrogenase/CBS domain-containing protein
MIPKALEAHLRGRLPESMWASRLTREDGRCFVEFTAADADRLARLGIEPDPLGPLLVVCMWDEASRLEVGGYLVVDNLAMGRPSMGGIRMLPDLTPTAIHNLARGMTLKNAAADLPYGGGKAGLLAAEDLAPAARTDVVRAFARLLRRYRDVYLPGPDVGTSDADMRLIAVENGLDSAVSKPADLGGNRIDELGAAARGVVVALEVLLGEMPRLAALPQFARLRVPAPAELTVMIQGFGAVGAHVARFLRERIPAARVVGVSDATGCLYERRGLPVEELFRRWREQGPVTRAYFLEVLAPARPGSVTTKYSSRPDDLLREDAFCVVPAAPVANYLDVDPGSRPSVTVDRMGAWRLSVEGANTYSAEPARRAARARMERAVYRARGVLIATDYLVNSGGVIFAAQERLIPTPRDLEIPAAIQGDPPAVERWLGGHAAELEGLAARRRAAAEAAADAVIRRNMQELIELLLADADTLPADAAEQISVRRITAHERGRTAADLMQPIPVLQLGGSVRQAAEILVAARSPILAVVAPGGNLVGVVTEWDITRATAQGSPEDLPAERIMTQTVVAARPEDSLVEVIRKLEHHEISAMPVVDGHAVLGMVSSDLLARRSLLRLLQSLRD